MATSADISEKEPQPVVLQHGDTDIGTLREDPDQQKLTDDINALKTVHLPKQLKGLIDIEKLKEVYKKAGSIGILLTGKTGVGKSTLINGILGLEVKDKGAAKEGRPITQPCTTEVTKYTCKKGKIAVTVWDSPGLQDGTDNQEEYLRQMEEQCAERDLTIYCVRVTEGRFLHGKDNLDLLAMEKLTKKFGVDFWKNTIIVLTFANAIEALHVEWEDLPDEEEKSKAFQAALQEWVDQTREILTKDIQVPKEIVDKIQIVPAGHYRKPHLLNRKYWLSALWFQCLGTISTAEKRVALVALNAGRLKREEEVKDEDFKQLSYLQPLVWGKQILDKNLTKIELALNYGQGALYGMEIGAMIGLFTGTLGGAIAIPVCTVIGALLVHGAHKKLHLV